MNTQVRVGDRDEPATAPSRPGRGGLRLAQVWAVVAAAVPMALQPRLSTVDLAYHIRAGQIMLRTHAVLRTDVLSFTAAGRHWLNQQWGAQILLAGLFRVGGWVGLAVAQAVLVGAVFGLVFIACRSRGASPPLAAGLSIGAFALSLWGLTLRPQLFGMILFAAAVGLVARRRRHPRGLWALPVLAALWANLHGSFFLAPALLALAWVEDHHEHAPSSRRTLGIAAVTAAATLLNPFGIRVWAYAFGLSTNPRVTRFVGEWQSPSIRHYTGALFFLSALAVAALLARRGRPVPWPSLLWLGGFFALGLVAVRGVFWWALAAPPVLAGILSSPEVDTSLPSGSGDRRPPERSLLNTGLAAGFVGLAAFMVAFPWVAHTDRARPPERTVDSAPAALTSAVRRVLPPRGRMFNAQRWGSWFELELPGRPVFDDSRIEVFPPSVWDDYLNVSEGHQGWQTTLARWGVTVVVADRGEQAGLLPLIRRDPGWRLSYQDSNGLVFIRA